MKYPEIALFKFPKHALLEPGCTLLSSALKWQTKSQKYQKTHATTAQASVAVKEGNRRLISTSKRLESSPQAVDGNLGLLFRFSHVTKHFLLLELGMRNDDRARKILQ